MRGFFPAAVRLWYYMLASMAILPLINLCSNLTTNQLDELLLLLIHVFLSVLHYLCWNFSLKLAATLWWFTAAPKPLKIQVFWGSSSPQGSHSPYILRGDTTRPRHVTCIPSLIQIGSKTAEKNSAQTNRQTDRHYENSGRLAVNQLLGIMGHY